MKKLLCFLLAAIMAVSAAGCSKPKSQTELTRYEASFLDLFDTVTTVIGYAEDEAAFQETVSLLYSELEIYHELYDIYNEYPGVVNIKTVNDNAGGEAVKVDPKIVDLLLYAKEIFTLTGGRTNVAMGSVLSIWHDYRTAGIDDPQNAALPPAEALEAAAEHTDIEQLEIDETASSVRLADAEMRLDVGALAKGYAAQRVCETLRAAGVDRLLVSIGGNVCAIGAREADGTPWVIGIQDPYDTAAYRHTVEATDLCVVTSGNYQRYYTVDGVRYHHIIDPDTRMPARYYDAVTVLCADSGLADGISTALYTMPLEEGKALVESLEGVEAIWIVSESEEVLSSGFPDLMRS